MKRLSREAFWRVDAEYWALGQDEDGYFDGTYEFQRGQSSPFPSEQAALAEAREFLSRGYWVHVERHPGIDEAVSE